MSEWVKREADNIRKGRRDEQMKLGAVNAKNAIIVDGWQRLWADLKAQVKADAEAFNLEFPDEPELHFHVDDTHDEGHLRVQKGQRSIVIQASRASGIQLLPAKGTGTFGHSLQGFTFDTQGDAAVLHHGSNMTISAATAAERILKLMLKE